MKPLDYLLLLLVALLVLLALGHGGAIAGEEAAAVAAPDVPEPAPTARNKRTGYKASSPNRLLFCWKGGSLSILYGIL
jgi:hypothetical protein